MSRPTTAMQHARRRNSRHTRSTTTGPTTTAGDTVAGMPMSGRSKTPAREIRDALFAAGSCYWGSTDCLIRSRVRCMPLTIAIGRRNNVSYTNFCAPRGDAYS